MILIRLALSAVLGAGPAVTDPRAPEPAPAMEWPVDAETSAPAVTGASEDVGDVADGPRSPPPPVPDWSQHPPVRVAVGLSPEAPGSREERELLDRLEASATASPGPPTTVRRLRAGSGGARMVCRERRDDLVISVGYVPGREQAVLLAHDCGLDRALGVRSAAAAGEKGLIPALWNEREALVRDGARQRRRTAALGPRARGVLIGAGVLVVVGVAVGVLVAGALREESVVLKVSP